MYNVKRRLALSVIECFHSGGQQLWKFIAEKSGTALGHQHGRRFIVLVRDIMVYVTSCEKILNICGAFNSVSYYFFLFFVPSLKALQRLAEELQSIQNRHLDIIGIPRTSLPTLEDRCNVATKRELERIVDDINHPNQIFLTKPNTSHGYNLLDSVAIPKSETQRHANSFIARAARLLLWSVIVSYFFIGIITW